MPDHSPFQKKVIQRYYDSRDDIMLARLGEIVTDLMLAESDKKRSRLWTRAEQAMKALKVSPAIIHHIVDGGDPEVLAQNLRKWLAPGKKPKPKSP